MKPHDLLDTEVIEATTDLTQAFAAQNTAIMKWVRKHYSEEARHEVFLSTFMECATAALIVYYLDVAERKNMHADRRKAIPDLVELLGFFMQKHGKRIYSEIETSSLIMKAARSGDKENGEDKTAN